MIPIRIMLQEGEKKFREYINLISQEPFTSRPDLNREPYSQEFLPELLINDNEKFKSKLDLGRYLYNFFNKNNIERNLVLGKNGLWTWLAYIWFDDLAPVLTDGLRDIKEDAKYICSSDYRDYYRHFIACPYMIYSLHGEKNSLIFLYSPIYEHNDFIEQFASRQFIISYPNIVETITKLYLDSKTKNPRKGAQSRTRKGNIRRFVRLIHQLELTYDIYSMSSDSIINLLPPEFNEWKTGAEDR